MKLNRLESTTEHHSRAAAERSLNAADQDVRRVETMEGVEGDRQRSFQQELAAAATGGRPVTADESKEALRDARQVAAQMVELHDSASLLVKPEALPAGFKLIDERA